MQEAMQQLLVRQLQNQPSLKERLANSVEVMSEPASRAYFDKGRDDQRWGETVSGDNYQTHAKPKVYLNTAKWEANKAGEGWRDKAILGETIHQLKNIEPQMYTRLEDAALEHQPYVDNAKNAFFEGARKKQTQWDGSLAELKKFMDNPDFVNSPVFKEWHRRSRFDQVLGGYLQGGDPAIPTMRGDFEGGWNKDSRNSEMFASDKFGNELKRLAAALGL